MNTHVFVVDTTTFQLHLEYLFAGTGAKDKQSLFLDNSKGNYPSNTERNLVGMIADISRVREGDNIIFYLQASPMNPGLFFGVFKAASVGFFDENDEDNYLKSDLGKGLSFRIQIVPYQVYPKGVTEHEYLDSLEGKEKPFELCWSMIYRKLKGNRGCTMITPYEYEDLLRKLKRKNEGKVLRGTEFSYCSERLEIVTHLYPNVYTGRKNDINILPRLLYKAKRKNAFETHLQAYIMQNFDKEPLKKYLIPLPGEMWIGNEVSCGVGMQRIDVLIIEDTGDEVHIRIIELKDEKPVDSILEYQLAWYVDWVSDYMVPNYERIGKMVYIHPCIIAEETDDRRLIHRILREKIRCSVDSSATICETEYIGFSTRYGLKFRKIV